MHAAGLKALDKLDREIKAWRGPLPVHFTAHMGGSNAKWEARALFYDGDAVNKLELEREWTPVSSTCPSSQEADIRAGPWDYSHDPV